MDPLLSLSLLSSILRKWGTAASPGDPRSFLSAAPENRAAIQGARKLPQPPTGRCSVGVGLHRSLLYLREARMYVTSPRAVTTGRARLLTHARASSGGPCLCVLNDKKFFGDVGGCDTLARTHLVFKLQRKVCKTSDTVSFRRFGELLRHNRAS